jgi:Tol biopolymer transport system component
LEQFYAFSLSPDGRRLATPIVRGDESDIWIYDLDRPQTPTRVTFGGYHNNVQWSTNGRFLVFGHYLSEGGYEIMAVDTRSGDEPVVLHTTSGNGGIESYDNESGELVFTQSSPGKGMDLMVGTVVLDGGEPTMEDVRTLRGTRYSEAFAAVSPDRRWIVAVSNETGRWELYLSSYPDFGQRVQISTTGGEEPIWTDDGSRVIYRWNDTWYEVDVTTEPELSVSLPREIVRGAYINVPGYSWDMTGDGERLLLLEGPQQDTPVRELQVITNFDVELDRLLSKD